MKFLLAGGAGSVGRDLTDVPLNAGHAVRVLDARADSVPLSGRENLEVLTGKVEDRSLAAQAVQDCDAVIHLAWSFATDPNELVAIDLAGQISLLEAAAGHPLEVPEDADGSFLHHDDLVKAILQAFRQPKTYGEIFNLATIYLSWKDLAGMIIELAGSESQLAVIPPSQWQGPQFLADAWRLCTCKAKQLFGFASRFSREAAAASWKSAIGRGLVPG